MNLTVFYKALLLLWVMIFSAVYASSCGSGNALDPCLFYALLAWCIEAFSSCGISFKFMQCKWNGLLFIVLFMHFSAFNMISCRCFWMYYSVHLECGVWLMMSYKKNLMLFKFTFKSWKSLIFLQKLTKRIAMSIGINLRVEASWNIKINKLRYFQPNFHLELIYPLALLVNTIFLKMAVYSLVCIWCS